MKRLHFGEVLEVRAAPGSMLADLLVLGGHSAATTPRANESAQEPQRQSAAVGGGDTGNGAVPGTRPQTWRDGHKRPETGAEVSRADRLARSSETERQQAAARDSAATKKQTPGDSHRKQNATKTSADSLFSDSSILVGTGLDDGLESPAIGNRRRYMDGESGERTMARASDSGASAGQLPDLPEGSNIAVENHTRDGDRSSRGSYHGSSSSGIADAGGSLPYLNFAEVSTRSGSSLPVVGPVQEISSPAESSTSTNQSANSPSARPNDLVGTRPLQTIDIGFAHGLSAWNIQEIGGSAQGKGTVTEGSAILHEGDSFLVSLDQDLVIPQVPLSLSFTYEATFDTSDPDSINDAFEAVLTAADGTPLVYNYAPDRDAYFNLTEQLPSALGTGTTEEVVANKNQVSTDISQIPAGTRANLLFRLVNNDADVNTTIHILDVQLTSGDDAPPNVTVGLLNDTAPDGPGSEPYRSDLLTNDPRISGSATDDHGITRLEVQTDSGPFVDITAALTNGTYSFDPGILLPGPHHLNVRATDTLAQTKESAIAFVVNTPPAADAGGNRTINEGETATLSGSGSTDAENPLFRYRWSFDDGSVVSDIVGSHVYPQNGVFPVSLLVTDTAGSVDVDSIQITVNNVAPTVAPIIDMQSNEGELVSFHTTFVDPGVLDTHTALIDWGDGTLPESGQIGEQQGTGTVSGSHKYKNDGRYSVNVRVTDSDGATSNVYFDVQVTNLAPTVVTATDLTGNEGQSLDFIATFTDSGILDTHTATVLWSDGTQSAANVVETNGSGTVTASHIFADNGVYPIRVDVTDNFGATGSRPATATIANVAPIVVAAGSQSLTEGQPFQLQVATFSDPGFTFAANGTEETFTAVINWGDGTPDQLGTLTVVTGDAGIATTGTVSGTHTYANNGQYTVNVTVTDDDGGMGMSSFVATVRNLAPAVLTATDLTGELDATLDFTATFSDPGVFDTHIAIVHWGDGSTSEGTVMENNGQGTVRASHAYATEGKHTIRVEVIDDAGDVGDRLATAIIVGGQDSSIAGYVYLDVNNNGVKDPPERVLPNVPITLTGLVTWTVLTAADGSYRFDDLPAGTYAVKEAQPLAFLDGLDTQGTPRLGSVANDWFHGIELPATTQAIDYNFGERGLRAELIGKQLLLASTPSADQIISTMMVAGGRWFAFQASDTGRLTTTIPLHVHAPVIEVYTQGMMPVALSEGEYTLSVPVEDGATYVLHVAGQASPSEFETTLQLDVPDPTSPPPERPRYYTNITNPLDTNADGFVSPLDALMVINSLNNNGQVSGGAGLLFLDVTGDELLSPRDALCVINYLNRRGSGSGEGEGEGPPVVDLVVGELDTSRLVYDGQALTVSGTISATVRNDGPDATDGSFNVLFFEDRNLNGAYDANQDGALGSTVVSPSLLAAQSTEVTAQLSGHVAFSGNVVWAFVDSDRGIVETNETNNLTRTAVTIAPRPGQFNPVVEWARTQFSTSPTSNQVAMTPAVIDINGDAVPDIVFSTHISLDDANANVNGTLRAVSGMDGTELWSVADAAYEVAPLSSIAVGDTDLDGHPEIVAVHESGVLVEFEHDGSFKWKSVPISGGIRWGGPSIADLNSDGVPEIIVGATVLNNDGTIRWEGNSVGGLGRGDNWIASKFGGPLSCVADIDLDGSMEVVAGKSAYRTDGSLYWNSSVPDGFPAVGNFDSDPFAEIVVVASGNVFLLEHTGQVKWGPVALPGGGRGGAAAIGDVDGDGEPEIGVAGASNFVVLEPDGTIRWRSPTQDISSNATGSSIFDFDGDGNAEVVYTDELYLRIYRGVDGQVVYELPKSSGTTYEYPLIADVDADGNTEIIAVANITAGFGPQNGIFVIGDANDTWVPTRQIWNQHSYHITNVNDDGTIPLHEENSWQAHNTYRMNLQGDVGDPIPAPDLTASYLRVAPSGSGATFTARIGNGGSILVGPNMAHAFYDGNPDQGGTLMGVVRTTKRLEPGQFQDISLTVATLPVHDVWVVADDDGTGKGVESESDETNNAHHAQVVFVAPTVVIESPTNGSELLSGQQILAFGRAVAATSLGSAKATLINRIVSVSINGQPVDALDASGNFFAKTTILPGENLFVVTATDAFGQSATERVSVTGTQDSDGIPESLLFDVSPSFEADYARTSFNQKTSYLHSQLAIRNVGEYGADNPFFVGIRNISDASVRVRSAAGFTKDNVPYYDFSPLISGGTLAPDGITGYVDAVFYNPNQVAFTYDLVFLAKLNDPPKFTTVPKIEAIAGQTYTYDADAVDPDNDDLSYSLITKPAGMQIDPTTGMVTWTPATAQLGNFDIAILATDGCGGSAEQRYVLSVINAPPNRPPYFTSVPVVDATVSAAENGMYVIDSSTPDIRLSDSLQPSIRATLAIDDIGRVHVTYVEGPDLGYGWRDDIHYVLVSNNGQIQTPSTPLNLPDRIWAHTIEAGDGGIHLAYQNQGAVGCEEIMHTFIATNGSHGPITQLTHTPSRCNTDSPRLALGGENDLFLVWEDEVNDPINYDENRRKDVFFQRLNRTGSSVTLVGSPVELTVAEGVGYPNVGYAAVGDIATDKNHEVHVVWADWRNSTSPSQMEIYYKRIDGTGQTIVDEMSVSQVDQVTSVSPQVKIDSHGVAHVLWTESRASTSVLVHARIDPRGKVLGRRDLITGPVGSIASTSFTLDALDRIHVLRMDISDGGSKVIYQRFDQFGNLLVNPLPVTQSTGVASFFGSYRGIDVAPDGRVSVVWTDTRDGNEEIYFKSFVVSERSIPTYRYDADAIDPDADPIQYSLVAGPHGMQINCDSGVFDWAPSVNQVGTHTVTIAASDGRGGTATQSFVIKVAGEPGNHAPVIVSEPIALAVVGNTYAYQVESLDPDSDAFTYSLVVDPTGMTIAPTTGLITWNAAADDVGQHPVTIRVEDGRGGFDVQSFTIDVTNPVNHPPVIVSEPGPAFAGHPYTYDVDAIDPDNDPLTYSLTSSTRPMTIDAATGIITWPNPDPSPRLDWAVTGGYESLDVCLDEYGNVYITGFFRGVVDFDSGPAEVKLTSAGGADGFIAKYTPTHELIWAKSFGGAGNDYSWAEFVDRASSVYIVGEFEQSADFDPGQGAETLTAAGNVDAFLAKLDQWGNLVWARSAGGTGIDLTTGVTVDGKGDIYAVGFFQGTVDFDPGTPINNVTSVGNMGAFVWSLDQAGQFRWVERVSGGIDHGIGGSGHNFDITADHASNVVIAGYFRDHVDFEADTGTTRLTSAGESDVFVAKMDSNGTFIWADRIGGSSFDAGGHVTTDAIGNVFLDGWFAGQIDVDPGLNAHWLTSAGSYDAFAVKLDAAGHFVWGRRSGTANLENASGIALDRLGYIYTSTNSELTKLDSQGNLLWTYPEGGSVAIDCQGSIYIRRGLMKLTQAGGSVRVDDGLGGFDTQCFMIDVRNERPGEIHGTKFNDMDGDGIRDSIDALLGPIQYLSFSDSPFDAIDFSKFYLEDFEDGVLNVPGVTAIANTPGGVLGVVGPSFYTDSVDADDGTVDGFGRDGHILADVGNRPGGDLGYTFRFDAQTLGRLPTHVGIVWTDGSPTAPTQFEVYDAQDNLVGIVGPVKISDAWFSGQTAEDHFFGVVHAAGIQRIVIRNPGSSNSMDVDHLQYGIAIIEDGLKDWTIYLDQNQNRRRDTGEQWVTTDENGEYAFVNLAPGTYFVAEETQSGWVQTVPNNGTYIVTIDDGNVVTGIDFGNQHSSEPQPNRPPVFDSLEPTQAIAGELLRYDALASDQDGDQLVFDLMLKPTGMAVHPSTGVVVWVPTADQIGVHDVVLRVQDGRGGVDLQSFQITVSRANSTPVITSQPKGPAIVGVPYHYQVEAQDADGDPITYRLDTRPAGMQIDTISGLVTWTPTIDQVGMQAVAIAAMDSQGASTTQSFDLPVVAAAPNDPPQIDSQPRATTRLNDLYLYQVVASDPNGDVLAYSFTISPAGMTIDAAGLVQWTPTAAQMGPNAVEVKVEDGRGGWAVQGFTVNVVTQATNRQPVITSNPATAATVGRLYQYNPAANDPDGDPLVWSLDKAPATMSISATTGALRWTPTSSELGTQEVIVRVIDSQGAWATQSYGILVRLVNVPPNITSDPRTDAKVSEAYLYAVRAVDPENDPLVFSLTTKPTGMTIDAETGTITWTPSPSQVGSRDVVVRVDDGQSGWATQSFTVIVSTGTTNHPPTITSTPSLTATSGIAYQYTVTASDPDGDALLYSLLTHPDGMAIEPVSGLIQWTPGSTQIGTHSVTVAAIDPAGAGGTQSFTIVVADNNRPPQISSTPLPVVLAGLSYRYDVRATDPDGDPIEFSLSGPTGMTIDALGRVIWNPQIVSIGTHRIGITATDSRGLWVQQDYDLVVMADVQTPRVNLFVSENPVEINNLVTLAVSATDNVRVVAIGLTINGTPVALDAQGRITFTANPVGQYTVVASASDAAGNTGLASTVLTVRDTSDVEAPVVDVTSPTDGAVITSAVDVIGTVQDANLLDYTLSVAKDGSETFTEIFHGTSTVANGVLGRFDPSGLANDVYVLRLKAVDVSGKSSSIDTTVNVAGDLKLGNFTLSFTDLSIPVSGIPITVARTYDSLNADQQDDLGYGWRLEIRDTNLRTNVEPTGMEEYGFYTPFSAQTQVYVTLPGGRRERFTFNPTRMGGFGGIFFMQPAFASQSGSTSTLSVPITNSTVLLAGDDGNYYNAAGLPYNPADKDNFGGVYYLTTKDGLRYEIDAESGNMKRITDPNQNTLTFNDSSIDSSTGKRILFERDPQGRIKAVVDPTGATVRYEYDAKGDLVAVTDREGNQTQLAYETPRAHYLTKIVDPLGRTGVRSEYDAQGRLVKLIDAAGKPVELIHDPNNSLETVKDALGNPTTFAYDERGNVVTEVDSLGGTSQRTYDANNNMLSETDPLGRVNTYTYDGKGNVLTETNPLGQVTRYTYGPYGRVVTSTDPLGNTTANTYDGAGNLVTTTDALGNVTRYAYDSHGNQTSITDASANVTRFEYDSAGNMTRQVDALANVTTYTYDGNGNQLSQTTTVTTPTGPRTLVTTTQYDSNGRSLKVIDAEGHATQTEYDALGNQEATIDALGRRTEFVYDTRGQLVTTRFADGSATNSTYDDAGRRIASTDRAGRVTSFVYDALGRLTETVYPDDTAGDNADNARTKTEYDKAGQVLAQIDERGNRTTFEYDLAGRRKLVRNALGHETVTTYDAAGRSTATTDALGRITQFVYDALGRQTQTRLADGTSTHTQYDALGRSVVQTDQAGRLTHFEYDALGRLTAVVDALNQRTVYGYDEAGNLVTQQDANGHITRYEYDGLGRRIATVLPLGERSTTAYDVVGNVESTTDFNGDTITFQYDTNNRLLEKDFPDGTAVAFTYTVTGQRQSVTDARGTTNYNYDVRDRLLSRTDPDGRSIAYTYDAAGNRTSVTSPAGTIAYSFDALNRLATITDPQGGATSYTYDAVGALVQTQFPNGTTETREYDSVNRLLFLENEGPAGVISSYRYTLDPTGNRTRVVEHDGRQVDYAYDTIYRLIGESITDSAAGNRDFDYTYDPVGNRLSRNDSAEGVTAYTYDDNDRLLTEVAGGVTTAYTYDDKGNTLSRTNATDKVFYDWDFENRLVAADTNGDGTNDVAYQYNADGIRVSSETGGEQTKYLIDTSQPYAQVVEEYTPGGVIKVSYVHGLDLISQNRLATDGVARAKSFYHVDGLGSTRALSNASGLVTNTYIYDAFGRTIGQVGSTGNVYLFAGEQRDAATGLDYLRARWMSPSVGRFYGRDPFEGELYTPVVLHRYLYAGANPVDLVDPSGQWFTAAIATAAVMGVLMVATPRPAWAIDTTSLLDSEVVKQLKQQIAAGKIIFDGPWYTADRLGKELLGKNWGTRVTERLQELVLDLSKTVSTQIRISSLIRRTEGSYHKVGQAVDIGNEEIASSLLPIIATDGKVMSMGIDAIIFDTQRPNGPAKTLAERNKWNYKSGVKSWPPYYTDAFFKEVPHWNHIHFAVK